MNKSNDIMMQESLHELIVEMKKLTSMCDEMTDSDDFDIHLGTVDKLSTILKRFADMGYSASGVLPVAVTPTIAKSKPKKGKEESE